MSRCRCGNRKSCMVTLCDECKHKHHTFASADHFCSLCVKLGWAISQFMRRVWMTADNDWHRKYGNGMPWLNAS